VNTVAFELPNSQDFFCVNLASHRVNALFKSLSCLKCR